MTEASNLATDANLRRFLMRCGNRCPDKIEGQPDSRLGLPQASKVTTIFHFNASSPSTPLAPFPFPSPPLPLLLSNKSWAKHSLPPCDLHLKGKLRRGIRAVAMAGREPASCQRYVTNKFVIYVYIILHGVGPCVCVSSVLEA